MRALITGVDGQDGSYLAEALLAEGAEVHGLVTRTDRTDRAERCPVPEPVRLHVGDLTDLAATRELILGIEPTEIYNLAAVSSVADSWRDPGRTAQVNALGAGGVLAAAMDLHRSGHPVHVVQASSAEIFGDASAAPQDESTPIRPVNPYGAAKAYAHHLVGVYRHDGLPASSLLLYNHESPRRPRRFVTRKITGTVAEIAQGRAERLVLGNLDARRDWGWAPDYVEAMRLAAREAPADLVIATGESHRVRDFAAAAFAHVGITDWESYVEIDPALVRPADPGELRGDATRARETLGWRTTMTFADIVGAMVEEDLR